MTKKPSSTQTKFINAVIARGATDVPGPRLFADDGGIKVSLTTLNAVRARDWVRRDERDGVTYWSVTDTGRAVVGEHRPDPEGVSTR